MDIIIQKEIENISQQIIEKYKPQKIILFGSAVEGNMTPDSDLDFLVIKDEVPNRGIDRARELRKLIKKQYQADFFVFHPLEIEELLNQGDPFIKTILAEGEKIYDRQKNS